MARYLIQNTVTGRFLAPSPDDFQPVWVKSLLEAASGIVSDPECIIDAAIDCCEIGESFSVIDLDKLGRSNGYQS